ncbi:MAG TPA: ankyrin repeat domain-containing protein [Chloroflexota bacterium]|nr:ankyrin repeat domain-containing protein [Chloroflexota bacterium]
MTTDAKPKPLDTTVVQEFVVAGHGDLKRAQEMLGHEPGLLNAANDWGGGDWETALGGAAHMGRRDIALFLLQNGARLDIFAAAMLGYLEIVKSVVATYPEMRTALGPHGIPLLVHAQAGGEEARAVLDYLDG